MTHVKTISLSNDVHNAYNARKVNFHTTKIFKSCCGYKKDQKRAMPPIFLNSVDHVDHFDTSFDPVAMIFAMLAKVWQTRDGRETDARWTDKVFSGQSLIAAALRAAANKIVYKYKYFSQSSESIFNKMQNTSAKKYFWSKYFSWWTVKVF